MTSTLWTSPSRKPTGKGWAFTTKNMFFSQRWFFNGEPIQNFGRRGKRHETDTVTRRSVTELATEQRTEPDHKEESSKYQEQWPCKTTANPWTANGKANGERWRSQTIPQISGEAPGSTRTQRDQNPTRQHPLTVKIAVPPILKTGNMDQARARAETEEEKRLQR